MTNFKSHGPRKPVKIPEVISEDELLKILNDPRVKNNHKKRTAYAFMFYCCLRVSEIIKLNPEDYNPNTRLLHIREAKGQKDRKIPISPMLVKFVKYLPLRSTKAKDLGIRAIQIAFKRDAWRVLNKDLHPHTLRHSGATYYLNKKDWDVRQLQRFLGHSDIKITQLYTHVNPEDLTKLMWDESK